MFDPTQTTTLVYVVLQRDTQGRPRGFEKALGGRFYLDPEKAQKVVTPGSAVYPCFIQLAPVATGQPVRRRHPQDPSLWPPSMTQDQIEQAIDDKCGCTGKHACDCASVFNMVRVQAWWNHNTKNQKPEEA